MGLSEAPRFVDDRIQHSRTTADASPAMLRVQDDGGAAASSETVVTVVDGPLSTLLAGAVNEVASRRSKSRGVDESALRGRFNSGGARDVGGGSSYSSRP